MPTNSTLGFEKMADADTLASVAARIRNAVDGIDAHLRLAETGQAWQTITPITNFANVVGYPASRYRKLAGGRAVRIEAAQTRSTSTHTAGSTIFTLAAGFRPTGATQAITGWLTTGSAALFNIATTGAVTCAVNITNGTSFVLFGDISLD